MFIYLSKFIPPFIYPLGLACLLILAGLLLYRHLHWQRASLILALAMLLVGGNHWVANGLMRSLEWRYLPPKDIPPAQVIVVLGGGTLSATYPRPTVEVNAAGDRILYAAWLYHHGKAPYLLLSGGSIDWLSDQPSPADDMATLLEQLGVPRWAMWLETQSRNTYENALYSQKILQAKGIQRVILVTSAWHMPRSVGVFEHVGLQVIPAPTDFTVTSEQNPVDRPTLVLKTLMDLLPSVENLGNTSKAMKEYLGILVYHLRGWL
jgi:uncharacterized SAM-binding protein YcdF (DUF218 family)